MGQPLSADLRNDRFFRLELHAASHYRVTLRITSYYRETHEHTEAKAYVCTLQPRFDIFFVDFIAFVRMIRLRSRLPLVRFLDSSRFRQLG